MAEAPVFYLGGVFLGIALGAIFVLLWRVFVPKGAIARIVAELASIAKEMARADEADDFFKLYKRLFLSVGAYLGRNFAGLFFACLPLVLVWTLLLPPVLEALGRQTGSLAVYPELDGLTLAERPDNRTEASLAVVVEGNTISTYRPHGRLAICSGQAYCLLFELLGFEIGETAKEPVTGTSFIVVRPRHDDGNPLWPYLGDLEFAFFIAFVVATLGGFMLPGRRR